VVAEVLMVTVAVAVLVVLELQLHSLFLWAHQLQ
jgi:hypothetical protein